MKKSFEMFPEAASQFATGVDTFYFFLIAISVFFTVLIAAALFALAIRYRRRSPTDCGESVHGSNALEITWSVIPLILALGIFFWGAHIFFIYAKAPEDSMEILVTGKQWMWKIQHPSGKREINELHVPMGQNIKLTMTSEDVIHSFFIPALRVKADVLPGRYTGYWFNANKPGTYYIFCAEYCGTEHSKMGGQLIVMKPADYQNWLSGGDAQESPVAAGKKLFADLGCVVCHAATSGAQGPNLVGVFGTSQKLTTGESVIADEAYIRKSILNPLADIVEGYLPIMPPFQGLINETQLMQIIAYIKSLATETPAGTP